MAGRVPDRFRRTGTQVFDVHQDARLAGKGIPITHPKNPRMSLLESLHCEGVRRKRRASRLLVGAWAIFFATSVLPSDCLVSPAAAHTNERESGVVAAGADEFAHATPTRHADCCQEVRAAALEFEVWAVPSAERPGSKPPALLHRAMVVLPAVANDAAASTISRLSPGSPVPTYLLTLRLRA